ncbi:MAG: sugar transferase [Chitinispirillaceae bacterium]|nr:sugar transferase [Chitinispirillaceae bacterium]
MDAIKDTYELYKEKYFEDLLFKERKRTERSKRPFVLIIIRINHNFQNKDDTGLHALFGILDECFRKSDIIGWYKSRSVIGIICPEVPGSMVEALREKVDNVVERTSPLAFRQALAVSYIRFPQNESSTTQKLSHIVYGELKEKRLIRIGSDFCKRTMDIIIASLMLVIFLPVMLVAAIAVKLTSPGLVFFRQERVGFRGCTFTFLKFRSMYADNDNSVHKEFVINFIKARNKEMCENAGAFKIVNDRRITSVGRILRKLSIDELPQLINVLLGDMSLVGPRPPIRYEFDAYDIWHRRRVMESKPGITGFWQVHGRSSTSFENMVRMDINYSKYRNMFFDIVLLLKTPLALLKGAY